MKKLTCLDVTGHKTLYGAEANVCAPEQKNCVLTWG